MLEGAITGLLIIIAFVIGTRYKSDISIAHNTEVKHNHQHKHDYTFVDAAGEQSKKDVTNFVDPAKVFMKVEEYLDGQDDSLFENIGRK